MAVHLVAVHVKTNADPGPQESVSATAAVEEGDRWRAARPLRHGLPLLLLLLVVAAVVLAA